MATLSDNPLPSEDWFWTNPVRGRSVARGEAVHSVIHDEVVYHGYTTGRMTSTEVNEQELPRPTARQASDAELSGSQMVQEARADIYQRVFGVSPLEMGAPIAGHRERDGEEPIAHEPPVPVPTPPQWISAEPVEPLRMGLAEWMAHHKLTKKKPEKLECDPTELTIIGYEK